MTTFRTNIKFGERYRDTVSGFEGVAVSMYFYKHGCERVCLKSPKLSSDGKLVELVFDAPELELVKDSKPVALAERKTGGPHDHAPIPPR